VKNALRTHSFLVIALLCTTLSACENAADESKNRLLSSGAVQGSIAEFTKAIKLDSTSAKAFAGRAAVKYATGDNKGAMTDLTKAIELNPKSATAYSARATAKFSGGDIPGAMADFISAAQIVVFSSSNKAVPAKPQ